MPEDENREPEQTELGLGAHSLFREGQRSIADASRIRPRATSISARARSRWIPSSERAYQDYLVRTGRSPERVNQDYTAFKTHFETKLNQAVENLTSEIRGQHVHTRAEVRAVRLDVLAAVTASPAEFLKLFSELAVVFLLFAIVVRFALKVELVNTAFAIFMLFACALYWCMASLKQRSERMAKRSHEDSRPAS